jgi:hypothetical protein
MNAFKFLGAGGLGPHSGFRWPLPDQSGPGAWVEVQGELALCRRGVHVLRPEDLAHWIHHELWELEVDGEMAAGIDCQLARRARLAREITGWRTGGDRAFARACVEHAALQPDPGVDARGFLDDAALCAEAGHVALAAFAAASAVAGRDDQRYRAERRWQSGWIADHLL